MSNSNQNQKENNVKTEAAESSEVHRTSLLKVVGNNLRADAVVISKKVKGFAEKHPKLVKGAKIAAGTVVAGGVAYAGYKVFGGKKQELPEPEEMTAIGAEDEEIWAYTNEGDEEPEMVLRFDPDEEEVEPEPEKEVEEV